MITADMANNEGRDVFTVPGNILTNEFAGNHWLLEEGAILLIKPLKCLICIIGNAWKAPVKEKAVA